MPRIEQLDPHIADLIAAGEVVERPASVVKELVENAIDAGARKVTVEIQHGGMVLIRVTDDGCGIAAEDAQTAFLRHATSKIRSQYDLEAIGTLGFRGEALAAIVAVSRVELMTREGSEELGTSLTLAGGELVSREEAGCPAGTTILVRDLFYNTPARLKFMKKDTAEGAAVFVLVHRLALSHPEVSVRFLRDGKQELLTPGSGSLKDAVYSVLGRDIALGMRPVNATTEEDITVTGFISLPTCCRGTRGHQYFFVNGRYIKSGTLTAALEEAYSNQKMVGKFPACVLHITLKPNTVDVNVHPTKTEVKFSAERTVFRAVYAAVKSSLEADDSRPRAVLQTPREEPRDMVTPNQLAVEACPPAERLPLRDGAGQIRLALSHPEPRVPPRVEPPSTRSGAFPLQRAQQTSPRPAEPEHIPPAREAPIQAQPAREEPAPVAPPAVPWRLVGELLGTYLVVEQAETILLIDKHAAHERMNFDRMQAQSYTPMVQELLTPVVLALPAEESAALLQHASLLERFGFALEEFGGGSLIVRGAPSDLDLADMEQTLSELAGTLLTTGTANPDAPKDAMLHTMACKAAMKAGQRNAPEELHRVAQAVVSGQVRYCPHGRPVAIEMTRGQLERQFKRA